VTTPKTESLMSIDFCPYVYDSSRDLWTYPDAARANPEAYEMNVSNENAAELLRDLGLDPTPDGGPIPIAEFERWVTAATSRHLDTRSAPLEPFTDAAEGYMTVFFLGRRGGYLEEKLGKLARLIQKSRAAGATHFGWG